MPPPPPQLRYPVARPESDYLQQYTNFKKKESTYTQSLVPDRNLPPPPNDN